MKKRSKLAAAFVVVFLSGLAQRNLGQIGNAVVVGKVQDTSGAILTGAEVQMKRVSTNEVFKTGTTETGDYTLVSLPVDTYEIRASLPGFKTEVRTGVKLEIGRTYRIDFRLTIGEIAQTVEVNAQAPMLKTETPEFGQVIDNQKIVDLPLNFRDVIQTLGALTPGMAPARKSLGGVEQSFNSAFNVRGNRHVDNVILLDGGLLSFGNGQLTLFVSPDAVQEFEVKTGLYGAEYGIRSGGQFSMITKSGTNALHGTLYEFHRNDNLDARNFFDPGKRPEFKRNQFGAVLGGPIVIPKLHNGKDKAWFFVSYAGERVRKRFSATAVVPTLEEKAGRFSTTITDPLTSQPFPNNAIPSSRFNPIAQKFLPYWPAPNTTGRGFNFTSTDTSFDIDSNQLIGKIDLKVSDANRWSGRFLFHDAPNDIVNTIDTFSRKDKYRTITQALGNTRTIGSRSVNEFGFNFNYINSQPPFAPDRPGFGKEFGIPNFPSFPVDLTGVPTTIVTGYRSLGDVDSPGPYNEYLWEARDNFSFIKGAHSFKTGYHFRRYAVLVNFQIRTALVFQPRYTGNAFGDFLLGHLTTSTQGGEIFRQNYGQNSHFFYFQDSWKVRPNLTLDVGLRYEYRGDGKDKRGFQTNFDPLRGQVDPPLQNLTLQPWETGRHLANVPTMIWGKRGILPRIGLAYRPIEKTVIRSGFGIYATEPPVAMLQSLGQNLRPNAGGFSYNSDLGIPTLSLSDPFNLQSQVSGGGLPSVFAIQRPLPLTLSYSWGLAVQRELSQNTSFEIGYQGAHLVHDLLVTAFNDAVPGAAPRQQRRPYPQFQNINFVTANGTNSYNGLEMKLERRPGKSGLSGLLAYTWAKSIDTLGGRSSTPGDPGVISRNMSVRDNRGLSEGNIPSRFSAMVGYEMPFGANKKFLTAHPLGKVLGGWTFNAILTLQRGPWITPVIPTDRLDVGSNASSRPDLIRNPSLSNSQRTPQKWFDTDAFATPQPLRYGNAGRSIIEAPGYANLDLSLLRSFNMSETSRLEFRFEAFNATNHTNFGTPGNSFGTSNFGVIGSAYESRDLQFGLKFYF